MEKVFQNRSNLIFWSIVVMSKQLSVAFDRAVLGMSLSRNESEYPNSFKCIQLKTKILNKLYTIGKWLEQSREEIKSICGQKVHYKHVLSGNFTLECPSNETIIRVNENGNFYWLTSISKHSDHWPYGLDILHELDNVLSEVTEGNVRRFCEYSLKQNLV